MASEAAEPQQNVAVRVANLPLVSSTCDMVSSAYVSTKENHPYLKSVCEVAEEGVKTIAAVTLASTKPIIQKLEPQIALANNCACVGLDKIEEKLPVLHQSTDKIVANATGMVVGAKEAVAGTVMGAKDTIAHAITGVVDKAKGAAQESMEMTKAVVTGSINSVLGSPMVQVVSTGVDAALSKTEALVDQYLPVTEGEAAKDATGTQKPSYYARLGSLSSKVSKQAYEQALITVKDAKCRSQEAISQLHHTIDLMEYAQKSLSSANQKLQDTQEKLHQAWVAWKRNIGQQDGEEAPSREHIESRALAIAQDLSRQLQTHCLTLVSSIQGLPQNIQNQAHHISCLAGDIYQNFHSVGSIRDLSDQLLSTCKEQLKKMKESMDEVMAYLANTTPLNWLVGPVSPEQKQEQASQQESEHSS
ncbi:perilipin-2-like isoform X1 [Rhinatrema bivittatum]|uniref:perilipin-2-like isoform X1 n=1 Tax=Rhinatrema bivittatum TaxID=194408 RepID=UPI00112B14CE|nr:perilipin-2-like isoform X1 [Rhinatrema bivittatum]XP_029464729.1 perilipin-2-like isoform X1 [Rhinatrema bivittatum]XP_029464739.1 perilipin-2-like isoform X1 [Rhinatrema bivittatum]